MCFLKRLQRLCRQAITPHRLKDGCSRCVSAPLQPPSVLFFFLIPRHHSLLLPLLLLADRVVYFKRTRESLCLNSGCIVWSFLPGMFDISVEPASWVSSVSTHILVVVPYFCCWPHLTYTSTIKALIYRDVDSACTSVYTTLSVCHLKAMDRWCLHITQTLAAMWTWKLSFELSSEVTEEDKIV